MTNQWNRRRFLRAASGAPAGLVILRDSRSVWGYHANDKLNVAIIGAGGMTGFALLCGFLSQGRSRIGHRHQRLFATGREEPKPHC